jgi:DNA replication protein DnaC
MKETDAIGVLVDPEDELHEEFKDKLYYSDLLILDELGTTKGGALVHIESLLRTRAEEDKATIVTTNLTRRKIAEGYPRFESILNTDVYASITLDEMDWRRNLLVKVRPPKIKVGAAGVLTGGI